MREVTEDLLTRMSHRVVEKLAALEPAKRPFDPANHVKRVVDDHKAKEREVVVKQVLRDELT